MPTFARSDTSPARIPLLALLLMALATAATDPTAAAIPDRITTTTLTLPANLEPVQTSWCTWGTCSLSPRLYHAPLADGRTLVGWTDAALNGHVSVVNGATITTTFNFTGQPVRGLVGHDDGSFAVLLWDRGAAGGLDDTFWLSRRKASGGEEWISRVLTTSNAPTEAFNRVGDGRLGHGGGVYGAYVGVHGISGFAEGHEGGRVPPHHRRRRGGRRRLGLGAFALDGAADRRAPRDRHPHHGWLERLLSRQGPLFQSHPAALDLGRRLRGQGAGTTWPDGCRGRPALARGVQRPGSARLPRAGDRARALRSDRTGHDRVAHEHGWHRGARPGAGPHRGQPRVEPLPRRLADADGQRVPSRRRGHHRRAARGPGRGEPAARWGNRDDSFRTRRDGSISWVEGVAGSNTLRLHRYLESTVGVDPPRGVAASLRLEPAYPNPLREGEARIRFRLDTARPVTVRVVDGAGRLVKELRRGWLTPGTHEARWDGCDASGARVAPGVYFCALESEGVTSTRKLAVTR